MPTKSDIQAPVVFPLDDTSSGLIMKRTFMVPIEILVGPRREAPGSEIVVRVDELELKPGLPGVVPTHDLPTRYTYEISEAQVLLLEARLKQRIHLAVVNEIRAGLFDSACPPPQKAKKA